MTNSFLIHILLTKESDQFHPGPTIGVVGSDGVDVMPIAAVADEVRAGLQSIRYDDIGFTLDIIHRVKAYDVYNLEDTGGTVFGHVMVTKHMEKLI